MRGIAHPRAIAIAAIVEEEHRRYQEEFRGITRRAGRRFRERDWEGAARDARERLELYSARVAAAVGRLAGSSVPQAREWRWAKRSFADLVAGHGDEELAHSFFNSVSRRVFHVVGQRPDVEFTDTPRSSSSAWGDRPVFLSYKRRASTAELLDAVLGGCGLEAPFAERGRDAARAAARVDALLARLPGARELERLDTLAPLFYRNKAAYLVGRIHAGGTVVPLVLALLQSPAGAVVDAVLTTHDAASVLFSFTRSYFRVDVDNHHDTIQFLKSIMPEKPVAELYAALGHNRHGKTELFRALQRHLTQSDDLFTFTAGERGMVMLVFTLPSYGLVFKVIRDRFPESKRTSRQRILENYHLVFQHDRVGRLIDALEFEQLRLEERRFDPALLSALRQEAGSTVIVEGGQVVLRHLYTERRVTPLDLYCSELAGDTARDAILDYGRAIKDLAAANIFPGDLFLKNFGVTRHGRVVFYDYDELTLLSRCRFRHLPQPRTPEEEMAAEPWYTVREEDVFPEEFPRFLGLCGKLRDALFEAHADLFETEFWVDMQDRVRRGEMPDFFPYLPVERLSGG